MTTGPENRDILDGNGVLDSPAVRWPDRDLLEGELPSIDYCGKGLLYSFKPGSGGIYRTRPCASWKCPACSYERVEAELSWTERTLVGTAPLWIAHERVDRGQVTPIKRRVYQRARRRGIDLAVIVRDVGWTRPLVVTFISTGDLAAQKPPNSGSWVALDTTLVLIQTGLIVVGETREVTYSAAWRHPATKRPLSDPNRVRIGPARDDRLLAAIEAAADQAERSFGVRPTIESVSMRVTVPPSIPHPAWEQIVRRVAQSRRIAN